MQRELHGYRALARAQSLRQHLATIDSSATTVSRATCEQVAVEFFQFIAGNQFSEGFLHEGSLFNRVVLYHLIGIDASTTAGNSAVNCLLSCSFNLHRRT